MFADDVGICGLSIIWNGFTPCIRLCSRLGIAGDPLRRAAMRLLTSALASFFGFDGFGVGVMLLVVEEFEPEADEEGDEGS